MLLDLIIFWLIISLIMVLVLNRAHQKPFPKPQFKIGDIVHFHGKEIKIEDMLDMDGKLVYVGKDETNKIYYIE